MPEPQKPATSASWTGWFRRCSSEPWRRVCRGDTEDATWRKLLTFPLAGDLMICRPGVEPNPGGVR
jgi:hypothetical protein